MRVLVAGATGYLGGYLVQELKERGHWVRALVRKEEQKAKFDRVDDFFLGEITKTETLEGVCNDIDWVISTIGITRQKDGMTYLDVDYQGNANLLQEAKKSSVKTFQYISAINGDKMRHLKIFEAKERFADELKGSGIPYSIMRPNGFFSDMRDFLDMAKSGRVYLFGDGDYRLNPIHGADLAKVCVDKIKVQNTEHTVGGPDTFTQRQLGELALKAWNKPIKVTVLPDWIRLSIIWIMRTFTSSKVYGPVEFFLTAMGSDNIADSYGKRHLQSYFDEEVKNSL